MRAFDTFDGSLTFADAAHQGDKRRKNQFCPSIQLDILIRPNKNNNAKSLLQNLSLLPQQRNLRFVPRADLLFPHSWLASLGVAKRALFVWQHWPHHARAGV